MTETTGSEHTPDHPQAETTPDNQALPTSAAPHPTAVDEAEVVVAPAVPTPVDPAELPAVSREVPATNLLGQPIPAPDEDGEDVSGSADPASLPRTAKRIVSGVSEALVESVESVEAVESVEEDAEQPEPEPEAEAAPAPKSWDELDLPSSLRSAIDALGWTRPTPVQGRTFATMVAGTDALVQSQTGSGKTGAFCLPWLANRFERGPAKETGVQLIVLLPTRELAKQVCDELVRLAVDTPVAVLPVYGGTAMAPQLDALSAGVHAVVGTPGRILDHIRRRSLNLSKVRTVVLDECDEMLSMGFVEDIRSILSACPSERQTCLFSATVPREIERIARRHMRDPVRITLSGDEIAAAEITHSYYSTSGSIKTRDLLDVIILEDPSSAIVFCNTREETRLVANVLQKQGYSAEALSSDLTQSAREKVMGQFRERNLRFLVATDVAARGIDVSHVSHVINFSFPENAEVYVHRTGRTGRAGRAGTALSIISPLEIGAFYTLTKSYKSIQFTERKLPPQSELAATRTEVKLDRISREYSEPVSPEWLLLARRLGEDPRGERVVAYLLHEAIEGERFTKRKALAESEEVEESAAPVEYRDRDRERGRGREDRGGRDRGRGRDRDRDRRGRDGERDHHRGHERGRDRDRDREEPRRRRRERRDELGGDRSTSVALTEREPTDVAAALELETRQDVDVELELELALVRGETPTESETESEAESEAEPGEVTGESDDRPKKRRRRRRKRKGPLEDQFESGEQVSVLAEAGLEGSIDEDDDEDTDEDEGADAESGAETEGGETEGERPKKRRRRKRRRARAPREGSEVVVSEAVSEVEQPSAEAGKKKRRRRRRRGSSEDNGETDTDTDTEATVEFEPVEETRVSQDEIIIDIDEQELTAVRDEFGEIDELDELTLKGRRRAVLEDLTEEMEVEDLTDRDAEDEDDDELETASEATAATEQPAESEGEVETAESEAAESSASKKKRRRRRRKKTPVPTPELTCPPHKDFWEVWAAKFSAADFQREEDNKDTDETVEDEPAPIVVVAAQSERESDVPLIDEAPNEEALVRVGLNIGRRHGHKAAHVRALLRRLTGLHGKAVKDLTVREQTSLFRMDIRHYETVVARLDGSVVEDVSLTLVHFSEDGESGDAGELPALRVPERITATADVVVSEPDPEPQLEPTLEPTLESVSQAVLAEGQPVEELVAAPKDA